LGKNDCTTGAKGENQIHTGVLLGVTGLTCTNLIDSRLQLLLVFNNKLAKDTQIVEESVDRNLIEN
jgi:hypothetical protein